MNTYPPPPPELLQLLAVGASLMGYAAARRTERLYERIQDLNRERLNVLEKSLELVPIRSRLEGLSLQLDQAVQSSISSRRLTVVMLALQWGMCLVTVAWMLTIRGLSPWGIFASAWTLALGGCSAWMWFALGRSLRTAEESTAHGGRHEFLFVSQMRRKS